MLYKVGFHFKFYIFCVYFHCTNYRVKDKYTCQSSDEKRNTITPLPSASNPLPWQMGLEHFIQW